MRRIDEKMRRFYCKSAMKKLATYSLIALLCWSFSSCGYHREGRGINLDESVGTIAVPAFKNDTFEADLEAVVTNALRQKIMLHRYVKLVDAKKADLIVVGVIHKFSNKPISFSRGDFAAEYRASIQARVKLVNRRGDVVWTNDEISEISDYHATPDIFQSELNKKKAIEKIAEKMARDIHDMIFDGFSK